jgi:C-terminal processing protease CtpA/Prc
VSREVTVPAQEAAVFTSTRKGALRASGLLAGTNLFYLDADGARLADLAALTTLLQQAQSADGLILDLRGVPAVSPYDLASGIVTHNFNSPLFQVPTWVGPQTFVLSPTQSSHKKGPYPFDKKVAVLIGPSTVSYAEVVATAIEDGVAEDGTGRVTTVGRPTAGTGGNPSVLKVPGGFAFGFTGMQMFHADGTTPFQGVGLSPDVAAAPTQADLANGVDTELEAAVTTLNAM